MKRYATSWVFLLCMLSVLLGCNFSSILADKFSPSAEENSEPQDEPSTADVGGDQGLPDPANNDNPFAEPAVSQLTLEPYDGGFFTVNIPQGWQIETGGQYVSFGFKSWDPQNPDYQIFFYGKFEPFLKNQATKQWYQDTSASLGPGNMYQIFADAPVLDPPSVEALFFVFNEFAAYANNYGVLHKFPYLSNLNISARIPYSTYFAPYATDEGMILAGFQSEQGTACTGRFGATVVSMGSYPISGTVDTYPMSVYNISGVMAPQASFDAVEQTLAQAVFSLEFTQEYVNEAIQTMQDNTADALAINAATQAVYDVYNAAWDAYIRE